VARIQRVDLERHLQTFDCRRVSESGGWVVWENTTTKERAFFTRTRELNRTIALSVCKDLGIPPLA